MATPLLDWLLVKKGDWLRPSHVKPSTGSSRLHPDRCGPYLLFPRSVVDPGGMETAVGVRGKPGRVTGPPGQARWCPTGQRMNTRGANATPLRAISEPNFTLASAWRAGPAAERLNRSVK